MKTSSIWVTIACAGLGGCGGGSSSPSGPAPDPEQVASGGMDGAGSLGIGIDWNSGILFQPVWEGGQVAYIVSNERDEDVDSAFAKAACSDVGPSPGCTSGEAITTWRLPARTLRKVSGADAMLVSTASGLVGASANTTWLGLLLFPELAPLASELAVVSNAGINATSGVGDRFAQVETDFLVAPSAAFTIQPALQSPGELTLSSRTDSAQWLQFADIVGAESKAATVQATDNGFSVLVPGSASAESPVRVAVDVELPEGFSGKLVGFDVWYCTEATPEGECGAGDHIDRAIPVETPLP